MKHTRPDDPSQAAAAEAALYSAILTLTTATEAQSFFHDLCTPAELQALADRWAVVALLREKHSYREIHRRTGVSLTTIGRVARFVMTGNGGYALAAVRTGDATRG
jgi:TrpR-related protein YerC/YecD